MRVLIVDDESGIRSVIAYKLRSLGYEVFVAENGMEGLEKASEIQPSILILDVNMPELDGFQVLEKLRSSPSTARIHVLMLTARSEVHEIEKGLLAGADDYLTKPFDLRELVARVRAAARIQSLQQDLLQTNENLADAKKALESSLLKQERLNQKMSLELEVAARLQGGLLSPSRATLGRCHLSVCYRPSSQIGGDFYDARALQASGKWSIFLADAAGHGVSAALLAAMLKMGLEEVLQVETRPEKILAELNRRFQFCADLGLFLSAFSCVLDTQTGHLVYAAAGQIPPLLHRHASRQTVELHAPGFCLGIFEDGQYRNREAQLAPGDRLILFTDGLCEAAVDDGEVFGSQLSDVLRTAREMPNAEFLEHLEARLAAFLGDHPLTDDYTLISIQLADPSGISDVHS